MKNKDITEQGDVAMTSNVTSTGVGAPTAPAVRSEASAARTRALLACGAVGGPLFIVVALAHSLARPGFDLSKHPISLLALGGPGWIQIGNFVVAGALFLACAVGMRRALHPGRAGTWGPILFGVFGVSLVAGGVFVADPGLGFPPGTPDGIPDEMSWHGVVHSVAPVTGFLALAVACLVFARRAVGRNQRGWAAVCVAIAVAVEGLGIWTNLTLNFVPLFVSLVLGFGWASAQAARLLAELRTE
jgi:hypothetical protein